MIMAHLKSLKVKFNNVLKNVLVICLCACILVCGLAPRYNAHAFVGIDDLVLYAGLGSLAVAFGLTINTSQSLVDTGRVIADFLGDEVQLVIPWILDFYNSGRNVLTAGVLQLYSKFSQALGLNNKENVQILEISEASSSQNTNYPVVDTIETHTKTGEGTYSIGGNTVPTYVYDYSNIGSFNLNGDNFDISINGTYQTSIPSTYVPTPMWYNGSATVDILQNGTLISSQPISLVPDANSLFKIPSIVPNISVPMSNFEGLSELTVMLDFVNNLGSLVSPIPTLTVLNPSVVEGVPEGNLDVVWVNNPALNPYNEDTNGIGIGDSVNFPTNTLTYSPSGDLVINPVFPRELTWEQIADSTGTVMPKGDSWLLNIPILGNILQWIINIFNKLVELLGNLPLALQQIISGIQSIAGSVAGTVEGAIEGTFEPIRPYITGVFDLVSGYALYNGIFNHFLPEPVAIFLWVAWETSVLVLVIRMIINRN